MEIKATLNKPYTDKQRVDFVVAQNHKNGYKIKETEMALEAWGLTADEIAQKEKDAQRQALITQLNALDLKCIRALRAIQSGKSTDADTVILADFEKEAETIRKQLRNLED